MRSVCGYMSEREDIMNKNPLSQWFNIEASRLESDNNSSSKPRRDQPKENQAALLRAANTNTILEANIQENQNRFLYEPVDCKETTQVSNYPPNFQRSSDRFAAGESFSSAKRVKKNPDILDKIIRNAVTQACQAQKEILCETGKPDQATGPDFSPSVLNS